jgi:hypothetical protein
MAPETLPTDPSPADGDRRRLFYSPVAARLRRRAVEAVGVIDVRVPQERYERATEWPRRHLQSIERPLERVQREDPQDSFGADHAILARYPAASASAGDGPPRHVVAVDRTIPAKPAAGPGPMATLFPQHSESLSADRAQAHSGHRAQSQSTGEIGPALRPASVVRARAGVISRRLASDRGSTSEDHSNPWVLLASDRSRAAAIDTIDRSREAPTSSGPSTAQDLTEVRATTAPAVQVPYDPPEPIRRAGTALGHDDTTIARSTNTYGGVRSLVDRARVASGAAVLAQRQFDQRGVAALPARVGVGNGERAANGIETGEPFRTRSLDASSRATALQLSSQLLQRFTGTNPPGRSRAEADVARSSAPTISTVTSSLPVESQLRRPHRTTEPAFIWRMLTPGVSVPPEDLPLAQPQAGETVVVSAAPPAPSAASTAGGDAAFGQSSPQGCDDGGRDPADLAEQVTRRLLRRLAVERERRGGSSWP